MCQCHSKSSDHCETDLYAKILDNETKAHVCCFLGLLGNLELELQENALQIQSEGLTSTRTVSAAVKLSADAAEEYARKNLWFLATPADILGVTANDWGVYQYIHCICKKVPFLWKRCEITTAGNGTTTLAFPATIFDLDTLATYGDATSTTVPTVAQFIDNLCCVKNHYKQIKAILGSH